MKAYSPKHVSTDAGKIPPQAVELEEAVLGAIMLEKDYIDTVSKIVRTESFYKEAHQKIFTAILKLYNQQAPVDILTVTDELKKKGDLELVGGPMYISQLTNKVASAAHAEYHARIIAQKHLQRELIKTSTDIQIKAYDDNEDVLDVLSFAENNILRLAEGNISRETLPIKVVLRNAIEDLQEIGKREDGLSGAPSGFTGIDRITSGWQRSDLIIVAARPSMGKTAFVLSMARNMAVDHNVPVAIFSLEMSSLQLVNRLIVSETEIPSEKIRNGKLEVYEWEQLEHKSKKLEDAPIFLDDTAAISIYELRSKCRRLVHMNNVRMIIVDYLQLMTAGPDNKSGSREQEVSIISRSLKAIAKELNVPIMALSQLNRSVEMRSGDKRPQLSDLRESGAIEQDADMVIFIHRPERYGMTTDEEGNSLLGLAEIIIAKHRNGATADVRLKFQQEFARFTEPDVDFGDSLGDFDSNGAALTYKSKMNDDSSDFKSNTSFDNAEPPF